MVEFGHKLRDMENNNSDDVPADLDDLIQRVQSGLDSEWEPRIRAQLSDQDRQWLEDQLVKVARQDRASGSASHRSLSRQAHHVESKKQRQERLERIRRLDLDAVKLQEILNEQYRGWDRKRLVAEGFLIDPPHKGLEALTEKHRSEAGEGLLQESRDLFYALLFSDQKQGVELIRSRRDFLTVTLPTPKKDALERFMLAVTETRATGTWLDPEGVSDDIDASNTILQVEYGDAPDHLISNALVTVLGMINELEVNEEILYARIECLQQSTLV